MNSTNIYNTYPVLGTGNKNGGENTNKELQKSSLFENKLLLNEELTILCDSITVSFHTVFILQKRHSVGKGEVDWT